MSARLEQIGLMAMDLDAAIQRKDWRRARLLSAKLMQTVHPGSPVNIEHAKDYLAFYAHDRHGVEAPR